MKMNPKALCALIGLELVFLAAVFAAFHFNYPPEVKTTILTVFVGWNGALANTLTPHQQDPNETTIPTPTGSTTTKVDIVSDNQSK